jgi:hypothetical protein
MGSRRMLLAALPAGAKVVARLGCVGCSAAVKLALGRRRAVRHFRRALAAEGLPDDVARDLAEAYPRIGAMETWRALGRKDRPL